MIEATAPGRVNLLGEHTDYTGGRVLPLAIDRVTRCRVETGTATGCVHIESRQFDGSFECDVAADFSNIGTGWVRYVLGVLAVLSDRLDFECGVRIVIDSEVPIGAGLSSSAALTVSVARAMSRAYSLDLDPLHLAQLCRDAERAHCGVECGLMDQAAASLSRPGHALLFDCETLDYRHLPFPDLDVWVVDSGIEHELAESEYNLRVEEAKAAADQLPDDGSPAELKVDDLSWAMECVEPGLRGRLRHIVTENDRVRRGVRYLEDENAEALGALMFESHESLRDFYEVSCRELDEIVEQFRSVALGAKMTGAGFGGSVVALVPRESRRAAGDLALRWPSHFRLGVNDE